ncbi:Uncharacterized protein APZ42_022891 [Daphnia magna]|uniref:Uncharacterized protein n=1 Tax=Daphnia magna TaxID=35525 RepID=A0A164VVU5_9CRUS|nr:Uncharacterized protein APZ42_022891 [Daphnia magna]
MLSYLLLSCSWCCFFAFISVIGRGEAHPHQLEYATYQPHLFTYRELPSSNRYSQFRNIPSTIRQPTRHRQRVWPLYVVGPAVDYPTYYALPLYADQFPYTELQPIDGQLLGEEQQSENPLAVRDQVYNEQPISKGGLPLVRGLFGKILDSFYPVFSDLSGVFCNNC